MHVCFDEDTHPVTTVPKDCVIGSMYLEKRTVEVCMSDLTIEPQEPRRPRFPFFHLHNVKERTPGDLFRGSASVEAGLPDF
jgi:hypothetical protein